MKRRRLWLIAFLSAFALLAAAVLSLLGTEAGTRWLWAKGKTFLPDELTVASVGGTLLSGLEFETLRWRDDTVSVVVDRTEVDLELPPLLNATLYINALQIDGVEARLEEASEETQSEEASTPDLPFRLVVDEAELLALSVQQGSGGPRVVQSIAFALDWAGTRLEVSRLRLDSDWAELSAVGNVVLEPPYSADATGSWRFQSDELRNPSGNFSLEGSADEYTLRHRLSTPVGVTSELRAEGLLDNWRVVVENRWADAEWRLDDETVLRLTPGELTIDATETTYSLSGQTAAGLGDGSTVPLMVRASGTRDALAIEDFSASLPFGNVRTAGSIDLNELSWAMRASVENGQLGGISPTLNGPFNVSGLLEGRILDRDAASGEITFRDIVGTVGEFPLTGLVEAGVDQGALSRVAAEFLLGPSNVSLDASVGSNIDAELEFSIADLSVIEGLSGGSATGNAIVSGQSANPSLSLNVNAADLLLGTATVDRIEAEFEGTQSEHEVRLRAERTGRSIQAAAEGGLSGDGWQGALHELMLRDGDGAQWSTDSAVALAAGPDQFTIERFCLSSMETQGNFCAEVVRNADASINARLDARGLPLQPFAAVMPERLEPSGSLALEGDLRIASGAVDGDVEFAIQGGTLSTDYAGETLSTAFTASATAEVNSNQLTSALNVKLDGLGGIEGGLSLSDVLDAEGALSGSFDIDVNDLSIVAVLVPDIQSPRGSVSGELAVTGTRLQPRLLGELRLLDGRFGLAPAGIEVSNMQVHVLQQRDGALTLNGTARSGEGTMEFDGAVTPGGDTSEFARIAVRGANVELLRRAEQKMIASPDVEIVYGAMRTTVTGSVDIPSANITADALPEGAARPSSDVVVHRAEGSHDSSERETTLDVSVSLGEEVRVAGYGLSTRVHGRLDVAGSSRRAYVGSGRLDLADGEYEAFGQTLTIERGELLFNGPLASPQLNIRAVREAGDVKAGVHLTGTPNDLRSSVYSEPAMRDGDALSYLLTGRPLSGASSSEGNTLNQAAFALGLSRAGAITEQIRGTLGLETLAVEGGADSSRVVAGKRLGGRLFVEYGYGLIDQLGTLLLRFQINDRLVVETSSGSATTLDLVYSVKKD